MAREALFGEKTARGRLEINDDIALFRIVSEIRKPELDVMMRSLPAPLSEQARLDRVSEVGRAPDSIREAARKQANDARHYPKQELHAVADRLRLKATSAELTNQDMADIEGLVQGNSPKAQLLADLTDGLRRLGVKVEDSLANKPAL